MQGLLLLTLSRPNLVANSKKRSDSQMRGWGFGRPARCLSGLER